ALLAITYVEGDSAWSWIRTNLLFGVFGISTYLLAPLVLYLAVWIAAGKPVFAKACKGLLLLMLLSGAFLVFSKTDMTGLNFNDGIIALHKAGASDTTFSGGVFSAVFGWSLLTLCGRPGANILLILFCVIGLMLVTGVTPADIYYFFSGKAGRVKESLSQQAEGRHARAEERAEQLRLTEQESAASHETFDKEAYQGALAQKHALPVDIDLGPDAVSTSGLQPEEHPNIGPGGTFGLAALAADAAAPQPESTRQTATRTRKAAEKPVVIAAQSDAPDLAALIQKATGVPSELALDGNDQLTIVSAGEDSVSGYVYPPLSLFQKQKPSKDENIQEELAHNAELLVKTLASFGVQTRVLDIARGPSVTRYELQPLAGVKISRITGLADDIALNLAAVGVRIEAPIPGKAAVGIEVPNKNGSSVNIRSILESPVFTQSKSPVTMALGKDIAGKNWAWDLVKMPHVLIAGSTGSGKSVCINAIIMSFLYKSSPEELKLIMIDPKMVELSDYNGIPHLLMPVVTEPRKAAGALGSAVAEMEKRYHLFAENGVRNIDGYNQMILKTGGEKMPYIAIIIDELADLMMVAGKEVEDYICRIAQKARAAGMHLIVATQRPSVDVITGLIKANIPSRIAFAVSSQIDSRTILDGAGAEKLLGKGDMLFMPVGASKPTRIQGTYVQDEEIRAVQEFIKKHAAADYDEGMIQEMEKRAVPEKGNSADGGEDDAQDAMFNTAVEV
ncbi:MAG: DNA translocase FtsK, partial [Ruthenibacterium sp.]